MKEEAMRYLINLSKTTNFENEVEAEIFIKLVYDNALMDATIKLTELYKK